MYSEITSGAVLGVSAYIVRVEVDVATGLPCFNMVGLLSNETRESRERVTVALKNASLDIPPGHITVNLSPADVKKEGTAFDLPIAIGMLEALGYFEERMTKNTLFLGELGLSGEIKPVRGVLPIVRAAKDKGIKRFVLPRENVAEGAVIPDITIIGVGDVRELLDFLQNPEHSYVEPVITDGVCFAEQNREDGTDFVQVKGQETAKRAAEIAAAGFHNLLMLGPPGAGKSMIAKRIPGILPPLTVEESLEVTSIYSVAGLLKGEAQLVTDRPFQAPHHSISQAALLGGGSRIRPGMISLAHRGVLFLDELPEFQRYILDGLRQPLEEHYIVIARAAGNVSYPADFMLVCALNPCPCGYFPDRNRCRCTEQEIHRYLGKISGPILDRIDLCVELQPVELPKLQSKNKGERSADIRKRVESARQLQKERFKNTGYRFNGEMDSSDTEKYCRLGPEEEAYMEHIYHSLQLSARAYHRVLKVARTIADLDGKEEISKEHLLEAVCYRPPATYFR